MVKGNVEELTEEVGDKGRTLIIQDTRGPRQEAQILWRDQWEATKIFKQKSDMPSLMFLTDQAVCDGKSE